MSRWGLPGEKGEGTALVVQWLRPCAQCWKGGDGLILLWRAKSHLLHLGIPHAAAKTQHNQINKYFLKKNRSCVREM